MTDDAKKETALPVLVKSIRDNILAHIELAQLQARITRAKYVALIEQGFTADEALTLCKT